MHTKTQMSHQSESEDPYAQARQDRKEQLSDHVNPWSLIQTHDSFDYTEVADASFVDSFKNYGIVKLRNALSREDTEKYLNVVRNIAGHDDVSFLKTYEGEISSFAKPGTVNDTPELWPMVSNPRVVKALRELLGERVSLLADSVFVHYSAPHLHRDCSSYHFEDDSNYNLINDSDNFIANVMHYLNAPGRESAKFGFLPFSHSYLNFDRRLQQLRELAGDNVRSSWFDEVSDICKASYQQPGRNEHVVWVTVEPTEVVIFDTRLLHQGPRMAGPKYGVSFFFGVSDEFTRQILFNSVLNEAKDGFGEFSEGYSEFLRENCIYPDGLDDHELFETFKARLKAEADASESK